MSLLYVNFQSNGHSIVDHIMVCKRNLLHLPLSSIIIMGYFGILSSLEGLLK